MHYNHCHWATADLQFIIIIIIIIIVIIIIIIITTRPTLQLFHIFKECIRHFTH